LYRYSVIQLNIDADSTVIGKGSTQMAMGAQEGVEVGLYTLTPPDP
jgi:hypothetical protein